MQIIYSSKFTREYKKLPWHVKKIAEQKEEVFRENVFHPSLKTHKLTGNLQGFWSFSIDYKYRIIFEFADEKIIYFHSVGTHAIYQ